MIRYNSGDIVGPYTLIERINQKQWKCECNLCNSIVEVFSGNMKRQTMCKNCRTEITRKPRPDISGNKYGRLTVIKYLGKSKWLCVCDCGKEVVVSTGHLMNGHTQSCGCYMKDRIGETKFKDLSGQTINGILIEYRIEDYISPKGKRMVQYRCRCFCGNEFDAIGLNVQHKNTLSCGCIQSRGEQQIKEILQKKKIHHKKQFYFKDLRSPKGSVLKFDFAIKNKDGTLYCLIEFQGQQHYNGSSEFGKMQREITDPLKREYCKARNILLYEIRYDDDISEKMNEIISKYKT